MTRAEFAAVCEDLSQKPDVDNVFEVLSNLRGQESLGTRKLTFREIVLHPYMLLPLAVFVLSVVALLYEVTERTPVATQAAWKLAPRAEASEQPAAMLVVLMLGLLVIVYWTRSAIRERDPILKEMRDTAAACVVKMAVNPRYVHEPFADVDQSYLKHLLKDRGEQAEAALEVLLSDEPGAAEPDADFRTGADRTNRG